MIKKSVQKQIDATIKEIWSKNIPKDYKEDYLINEDCLKMALCYHMRRKMATLLKENNLRIYTEKYLPELKKKPDIIIAEVKNEYKESNLYDSIHPENVVALIELKFQSDTTQSTADWIKEDIKKLKEYAGYQTLICPLYFAIIYEVDCEWLHWFDKRSTNNWAAGRVTELDAGWINGNMEFEVHSY